MKKFYKIILLLLLFIFLSTFNPKELNFNSKKKDTLFRIQNVEIIGNFLIDKSEVEDRLNNIYKKNIFFLKKHNIEEPLREINFLEKIEVKKKYPNAVVIKIFETKPIAVLIKNKIKYILDSSSNLILFDDNIRFRELPNVFGEEAEIHFINFFNLLNKNHFPYGRIKSYYYFQIGRWDLQLANNKIIKFPDTNTQDAIIKSIELLDHKDFKNYNIIDLRVNGKIIVE